jgi:urease accessory protein
LTVNVFHKHLPKGLGLAQVLINKAPFVSLAWDQRQKSRLHAMDSQGQEVAIFIPRGKVLRSGDVLLSEEGAFLRIESAPESLLHISACPIHSAPHDLLRAAYHLGNRHIPIEVQAQHLKIEPDHVLENLLVSMGLIVKHVDAPFEPESGAYAETAHAHSKSHHHGVDEHETHHHHHDSHSHADHPHAHD